MVNVIPWSEAQMECSRLSIMFGHLSIVQFYVQDLHCHPHVRDISDSTPLHCASVIGKFETVKYLATINSSISVSLLLDEDEQLPIHYASSGGHIEVIKFLEHLNDIHAVDRDGQSCLHVAAMSGQLRAVEFFINDRSFDPAIEDFSKVTPLHLASWKGNLNVVSYLVCEKGCNPDNALDTPLHWAASEGQLEVVQFFGEKIQCSLFANGENNKTPLDYAIFYNHPKVQQYLTMHYCSFMIASLLKIDT